MSTYGPAFEDTVDGDRLRRQHYRIREFMFDNQWHTLSEISVALNYPEASISANLRHLRKPEFGSYTINKRRRDNSALWEYRLEPPTIDGQPALFNYVTPAMRGH